MKRKLPLLLICGTGAILFFCAGLFTGQRWLSEPTGMPEAASQRARTATRLLPAPPFENKLSSESPRRREREDEPSPEEWIEQTEKRAAVLATQLESLRDLTDDKLIIAVRALNLPHSSVTALYSQYIEETAALEEASQGGYGQRHPKIIALNASLDIKYAQLLEASESLKRDLEVQLTATQRMLTAERAALKAQNAGDSRRQVKSASPKSLYETLLPQLSPMVEHRVQISTDAPDHRRADGKLKSAPAN